jgi:hypothetical protein
MSLTHIDYSLSLNKKVGTQEGDSYCTFYRYGEY